MIKHITQNQKNYLTRFEFILQGIARPISKSFPFQNISKIMRENYAFEKARTIVPFFYYFMVIVALYRILDLSNIVNEGQRIFAPRWPIFWADYLHYLTVIDIVHVFFILATLTGAFFYRHRAGRFIVFLGILEYHALRNSFGVTYHNWDIWVWIALLFIFLPDAWGSAHKSPRKRKRFLLVFWGAQAFVLLMYSMSGMWKIIAAAGQYLNGEASAVSFDAFSLHISTQLNILPETMTSMLGPLIINYPLLGWLPLIAIIYLQSFSFFIAFRPSLHSIWALGLIFFHVGAYLTIGAEFFQHIPFLLFLFLDSPFRDPRASWRQTIADLPIFGWILGYLPKRNITNAV